MVATVASIVTSEPPLVDTFSILFDDIFTQTFLFTIESGDDEDIDIGNLRPKDSFLTAQLNVDGSGVEITVDGP